MLKKKKGGGKERREKKIICSLTKLVLADSEASSGLVQAMIPTSISYMKAVSPINFQIPFVSDKYQMLEEQLPWHNEELYISCN